MVFNLQFLIVSFLLTPFPVTPLHTDWLGPQQYPLRRWGTKRLETAEEREKEFGAWEITIKVEKLKDVKLPEPTLRPPGGLRGGPPGRLGGPPGDPDSREPLFTVENGKYKALDEKSLAGDELCIHTQLRLKPGDLSKTYYIARARITSGPLKGNIVNLLDEHPRGSGTAGVFRIPVELRVDEGPLEFELIEVWGK